MNFVSKLPPPATSPSAFEAFWRLGYRRLIPIIPPGAPISETSSLFKRIGTAQDGRGKIPGIKGRDGKWRSFNWIGCVADERDIERWTSMGAGVGFLTGEHLVGIDVDTMADQWSGLALGEIAKRFGPLPLRSGNVPKFLCVVRLSTPMKNARIEFGESDRIEILTAGRQFVGAGIHPKTMKP